MQRIIRKLSLLTGIILTMFFLIWPSPAQADAPICSLPNTQIPDGSGTYPNQIPNPVAGAVLTDSITIDSPILISDLNLVISVTHSYVGDLAVTLTHTNGPTQTQATVINMPLLGQSAYATTEPACSGDNIRLTLDDEGLYSIQTDCAEVLHPATRNSAFIEGEHYMPASPLSAFDGEVISGTWEIAITDNFAGDTGRLDGWCLAPNNVSQDLYIVKEISGSMIQGDPLTYTISFINQGIVPVTSVVLTDIIPAELTGVSVSHSGAVITDTAAVPGYVWNVEPLSEGEGGVITITGFLSDTAPGGTIITNTTRINGNSDNNPDNNQSVVTGTVLLKPDVIVTQSGGSTNLLEGSSLTDTYTIALTTQPTHNVVITLTHDNQVDVSAASLTFIPATWHISQTVTVTATDDGLYEGIHTGFISHTVTSSDSSYNGQTPANVVASIIDDEQQPTIQFTSAASNGNENVSSVYLHLSLTPTPSAQTITATYTVSGTATGGTDHTLSNGTVTIQPGQSSATMTLTVTNDFLNEPDETVIVMLTNPVNTSLGAVISHTYTIFDNDTPGITLTQSGGSTAVTEGGATDSYQLVLTSQPAAPVTITVASDSQVSGLPATLNFTGLTWNQPQTVTVSAVNDAVYEGPHSGLLTHTVTSTDGDYSGLTVADVSAAITDNDSPPDTTPPTAPSLITPTNSITLTTARPVFRWNAATDGGSGVISYTLTLTNSGIATNYIVSQTSFTPTIDLPDGSYLWTVTAHDGAGNTGPSAPATSFIIDTAVSEQTQYRIFLPLVIK